MCLLSKDLNKRTKEFMGVSGRKNPKADQSEQVSPERNQYQVARLPPSEKDLETLPDIMDDPEIKEILEQERLKQKKLNLLK